MTQQNAALVEESSAAATPCIEQAQRLAQVVAVFNVGQAVVVAARLAATRQRHARAAGCKRRAAASARPQRDRQARAKPVAAAPARIASAEHAGGRGWDDDWKVFKNHSLLRIRVSVKGLFGLESDKGAAVL